MFNIYYINYVKAYEIAMLIDNQILTSKTSEQKNEVSGNAEGDVDLNIFKNIPIFGNLMPSLDITGGIAGSKMQTAIDTIQVVHTKSTILRTIYNKCDVVKSKKDFEIGKLVKIENISLGINNLDEVQGLKALLSGFVNKIPIEGLGDINLISLINIFSKYSNYILEGKIAKDDVVIRIPIKAEEEFESQYSIFDLNIGTVTILGIYRGKFNKSTLISKIEDIGKDKSQDEIRIIETEGGLKKIDGKAHFIDVIGIIQELKGKIDDE